MKELSRFQDIDPEVVPKTDKRDLQFLKLLANDGRLPLNTAAKQLRISPEGCGYRLNKLQEKGIIQAFIPNINLGKLGYTVYHVFLLLDESHREKQKELLASLSNHPNIKSIIEYVDRWDYEIVFIARSVQEFDGMLMECLKPIQSYILEKEVLEGVKEYYDMPIPSTKTALSAEYEQGVVLDASDRSLISALSTNARASTYELGRQMSKSPDAVMQRIKSLKERGIIRGFSMIADLSLLSLSWNVMVITTKTYDAGIDSQMRSFVQQEPNVIYALRTLGTYDFLFYIVSKDSHEYYSKVRKIKSQFSKIIKTYDAWDGVKEHTYNPVPHALVVSK